MQPRGTRLRRVLCCPWTALTFPLNFDAHNFDAGRGPREMICMRGIGILGRNGIEESPTWRVVVFLFLFLLISVLLEHFFHYAEQQCMHHGQTGIVHVRARARLHVRACVCGCGVCVYVRVQAIHKIKEELMLLGFISLLLLVIEEALRMQACMSMLV